MKYVCAVTYFPNCRVHDSDYFSRLVFFNKWVELLDLIHEGLADYEYQTVYECKHGAEVEGAKIRYEFGGHRAIGCTVNLPEDGRMRLVDDGHGKKIWVKED